MSQTALLHESGLTSEQLARMMAEGVVSVHPHIVSGAVVFAGTRVPVYNLWDYLRAGDSLSDFLESFPTVHREQAQEAIELRQRAAIRRQSAREHSL